MDPKKQNERMKLWTELLKQVTLLTQFGLTLLTPLLLCLGLCYLLTAKAGWGGWIYILGFFFGLGGSGMVAWKFYLQTMKDERKSEEKSAKKHINYNRHI